MTTETHNLICKGIKTHNLKNININIPLKKWIAITGVSGSGKSSLAFDTIYSESQRRFLETLGTYERQFLQGLPQGDFDEIDNIPAAIALKQSNKSGDPRSVIASVADISDPFRTLFISLMDPSCTHCGSPVSVQQAKHLVEYILSLKNENKAFLLTVPYELLNKKAAEDLIIEGYTRIILNNKIYDIQDYLNEKPKFPINISIILDRIHNNINTSELENRIETVWSQVRFSPKFFFVNLSQIENDTSFSSKKLLKFHVQPFCKSCQKQTSIIQNSDLDWQSVLGACKKCQGLGNIPILDENKIIPNKELSLSEGAIRPWTSESFSWLQNDLIKFCKKNGINTNIPYSKLSKEDINFIWNGDELSKKTSNKFVAIKDFFGVLEEEKYKSTSRILLAKYRKYVLCPDCEGARVGPAGKNAICFNKAYHEIFQLEIKHVLDWLINLKLEKKFENTLNHISYIYDEVFKKITLLNKLGLGSAQLFRRCKTLSGGEYQRVLLTRVIGNGLTDALYVLDEPSIGLGKNEIPTLIECLQELRDLGNTILMVEHDKDLILAADEIFELGPGGGEEGGYLLDLNKKIPHSFYTKLNKFNSQIKVTEDKFFSDNNVVFLQNFSALNCQNINLELALQKLNVVTGPSGAGKTTLIQFGLDAALEKLENFNISNNETIDYDAKIGSWENLKVPKNFFSNYDIISVEQKALHRTSTSVPATILGLMDILRKQFAQTKEAKLSGFTISDFSFNGSGACENCNGKGVIQEDLFFLGEVEKICPDCNGTRYRDDVLKVIWQGKNIHEWLKTTLFECKKQLNKIVGFGKSLEMCCQLGLGHIPLGLTTSSMSGGEAQRLRICAALTKSSKKIFCILDEPTRGLSENDVGNLLESLLQLCIEGHTFVVVEHHELFQRQAHHLIKLGPGSGVEGGKIVERWILKANLD